jgi:ABC-type glycerol-3-phosphate transport system permease component
MVCHSNPSLQTAQHHSAIVIGPSRRAILFNNELYTTSSCSDFAGPLYFLPGSENVTVQLTLFSFISQFSSQWNLLFANVVVITIPPLIMFIFFQRQIVSGMTSGAVKG